MQKQAQKCQGKGLQERRVSGEMASMKFQRDSLLQPKVVRHVMPEGER